MPRCSLGPQGRAEPAPPGGASPLRMAYRGRPGDHVKNGFLGGARSPRPCGKAVRKPRHNTIIGGKRTPGGLAGPSPGRKRGLLCGRAEPAPPRPGQPQRGSPSGERPEMTRKAIFSEGRGLRARIARHHEWRGPSLPPEVRREAGGLIGIHGEGVRPSSRACRARPSGG